MANGNITDFYGKKNSRNINSLRLETNVLSRIIGFFTIIILISSMLFIGIGIYLYCKSNFTPSPYLVPYDATTSVEKSNYTKDYYGLYDWESGIPTDWLYSGDVGTSSIDGHDSVVWLNGGGSHPTLVLTISNFVEYEPANNSQIHTISMWLYPNNTCDVSVTISPQLFIVFNASDSHLWYLDFTVVYGGAWLDTGFTYLNNTWLYLEWSFDNVGFNITVSYPPTRSVTPIVVNASLNPYFPLPQPNYLDYILFTTMGIETDGFYIDTINFDWLYSFPNIPSSNIPSDASWFPIIYMWMDNFTFQFDNNSANFRNVWNLTIHYNETVNSDTPIRLSVLQQWQWESDIITIENRYFGLDIPANYHGDLGIDNELYSLYINDNGTVNLVILHGTSENTPNDISASMSGYFWNY